MLLHCKQFFSATGSVIPKCLVFIIEKGGEAANEGPKQQNENVDDVALQDAKREYSDRWELLKKFRDRDQSVQKDMGLDDDALQKLSLRAEVVMKEFQRRLKTDKDLVDPEKIFTPQEKDKERIQGTLVVLDGIIDKYGSEKKGNAPEWLTEAVSKNPKEEFQKASSAQFERINHLRNPIMGGGATERNPYTQDYIHDPGALAMLDHLMTKIGQLGKEVQGSKNVDFITAATAEIRGMDAEVDKICRIDTGRNDIGWALEESFYGSASGKGFNYLPKNNQSDHVLLDRFQSRLKFMKSNFDLTKIPAGSTWTFDKQGFSITVTKGEGRDFTAKINNVGSWVVEKYGATFVKYLAPEDRKHVKEYDESTGRVVMELPSYNVPVAVESQYAALDPQFDKDPSPKTVTVDTGVYIVSRETEKGKKTYKVDHVIT